MSTLVSLSDILGRECPTQSQINKVINDANLESLEDDRWLDCDKEAESVFEDNEDNEDNDGFERKPFKRVRTSYNIRDQENHRNNVQSFHHTTMSSNFSI